MHLKSQLTEDMKASLRSRDMVRVSTIRMALAAIQQREIDAGRDVELAETDIISIIEKLIKQRRESAYQFRRAGRENRALEEEAEASILERYLPEPLDSAQVEALMRSVIHETGAQSVRDMGLVMGVLKAQLAGRADLGWVSKRVKELLST